MANLSHSFLPPMRQKMDYIVSILVIMTAIFLHELGHFLEARRLGLRVKCFSVGYSLFGKNLYSFTWKRFPGTEFTLGPLLIGGFVELEDEEIEHLKDMPYGDRALFSGAGVWANLVTVLSVVFLIRRLSGEPFDRKDGLLLLLSGLLFLGKSVFCRYIILPCGLILLGMMIYGMAKFGITQSLAGPITVVQDTRPSSLGAIEILEKLIDLSGMLATINMLPLTPLDGGALVDALLRRWQKTRTWFAVVTGLAMFFLVGIALFNDVKSLIFSRL